MSSLSEFNLIRDPWIPVITHTGSTEDWSLRTLFHRAHEARSLNESSPLAYTATLRLILAIAHRAIQGPATDEAWYEIWERRESGFDHEMINAYLDRWEHRFNLFDDVAPFGQVIDFDESDEGSPISRLILEQTSGSNTTLFGHSRDDRTPPVTPATAAKTLLVAHQYAFAGTAGRYMQAPMVAGYAVSWEGESLYETIILNMVLYGHQMPPMLGIDDDMPFWEDDELTLPNKQVRAARGLTDLYTFRGRRLQLLPDEHGCIQRVRYDQGLVLDLANESLRDPFKRYLAQKQANALLPRNFGENRALWRDADGLIEESSAVGTENEPPRVMSDLRNRIHDFDTELASLAPRLVVAGLVNNQARISLWRMDRMAMPLTILADPDRRRTLHAAITDAENAWSSALSPAARWFANIGLAGDDAKADSGDIASILSRIAIAQRYWSRLDREFQTFIMNLGSSDDIDAVLMSWRIQLRRLCETSFRDATTTLGGGRWYQAQSVGSNHLYSLLEKIGFVQEQKEEVVK